MLVLGIGVDVPLVSRAPDSEFLFIEMGSLKFYDWLIDWLIGDIIVLGIFVIDDVICIILSNNWASCKLFCKFASVTEHNAFLCVLLHSLASWFANTL